MIDTLEPGTAARGRQPQHRQKHGAGQAGR